MLDFKELSSGDEFELLVRELLYKKGMKVYWSGKGPDGGKDLLCIENVPSNFKSTEKTWLIQCKHNAHSQKSVGVNDLDDIITSCHQHNATGYLLVCSTFPSSKVVERLDGVTKNDKVDIIAEFWDGAIIERELSTPQNWPVAQRFFPNSANKSGWVLSQTDNPNAWRVNYRGYYFHLANRIGSSAQMHFQSIDDTINEIESIELPENHHIRVRAVHYDDKNANYTWFIDYLYPNGEELEIYPFEIQRELGDGFAHDDGQFYYFDVQAYSYNWYSDHFDIDHYDYYEKHMHEYQHGYERKSQTFTKQVNESNYLCGYEDGSFINEQFELLVKAFGDLEFVDVGRCINANFEEVHRFNDKFKWLNIIEDISFEVNSFFSAKLIFECADFDKLVSLLNTFPQTVDSHFRLKREFVFLPDIGLDPDTENEAFYSIELTIHPANIENRVIARKKFNQYFKLLREQIEKYAMN